MTNEPIISVIVPFFNAAVYLPDTIACLQSQHFKDFEAIFVDDGSSDNGAEHVRGAMQQDPRFVLEQQRNSGVSVSRNRGLAAARGQWVAFLDSDDFLRPDALDIWMQSARALDPDVVLVNGFRFHETPDQIAEFEVLGQQPWGQCVSGKQWIVSAVAKRSWKHYVWLQMIRRSFIEDHAMSFAVDTIHEDILWTTQLALYAQRISFVNERVYGYRVNLGSLTGSVTQDRLLGRAAGYVKVICALVDWAEEQADADVKAALLQQAITEAGHLMGLFRKRLQRTDAAIDLARVVSSDPRWHRLYKSTRSPGDFWRLLRLRRTVKSFCKS
jgi:glycosyltransferase involved in cell wall biosynthesis